tara:strand:- start:733 stop:858 length:126 start_codon:yes stop_codon:yes gene_type:complete
VTANEDRKIVLKFNLNAVKKSKTVTSLKDLSAIFSTHDEIN